MASDTALFMIYKPARRDFIYYAPQPRAASVPISFLARISIMVVADFSCAPVMRLPDELGGFYYSFNH